MINPIFSKKSVVSTSLILVAVFTHTGLDLYGIMHGTKW